MDSVLLSVRGSDLKQKVFKLGMMLAVLMSVTSLFSQNASASAYGCAFGNPSWGPSHYCVNLSGSGTYVNYVSGSFGGSGLVCDANITAEFFDTTWRWYETRTSSTKWGCATAGSNSINIYAYKKRGYMCSTLRYNIAPGYPRRSISVCHQIR